MSPQRSIESYGVGQSGYTAGRTDDLALELQIELHNQGYPYGSSERLPELGLDDRWTGRGGPRWDPEH